MIRILVFTGMLWLPWLQGLTGLSNKSPKEQTKPHNQTYQKPDIAGTKAPWVKNAGQWDEEVLFVAHTFSGNVIINDSKEILYAIPVDSTSGYVLKERFVGPTNQRVRESIGEKPTASSFNYFIGNNQAAWTTNVPSYEVLHLGEIWEGVEVKLHAYNNNIEKLFHVKPNQDPQSIQVTVDGADQLEITPNGQLMAITPVGQIAYTAPVAYQWIKGKKHLVKAAYHLSEKGKNTYSFIVKDYDPQYELIIDPLLASTFIGDGDNDWGYSIAVDENGNVFVTGYAWSDNFPSSAGSYNETFNGIKDAFVSKLTNDLSTLLASTFLGGSSWENGHSVIVESTGDVLISGATGSRDFPMAGASYDNTYNGGTNDVFVCKLNNDLSTMIASTYIGGGDDDYGYDLTLDNTGNVFVTGRTESDDYPAIGGFDNTFNGGFEDVFVSKLNNGLSSLLASTYIGGNTDEGSDAIITDDAGNVFISGFTYSDDFPTAGVPYDDTHNGSGDIFVAKFNNNLSMLTSATFIGGTNFEESHAMTLDSSQNVFIAGYTGSPEYPSTPGVYDETFNENHDAIITKLDNNLSNILASTFIGGTSDDDCYGLVIEGAENVFITGISFSTDYPTTGNATDDSHNGERDIFLSRFSFDLSELIESTYLGGGDNDWALDLTIDDAGSVFIGGGTYSGDFPMEGSPYDNSFNGGEDVIIAKIVGCGVNDFCDPELAFGSIFLDIKQDTAFNRGCSATANPGPMTEGGCFNFPAATVWYTFTPEVDLSCIKIAIDSEELPEPQLAVFQGACPGSNASLPFTCDTGSGGILTIHMGVEANETYFIAVSDNTGAEGYFNLSIENDPEDALSLEVVANDLRCFESNDGNIEIIVNNGTGFLDFDWNIDELDGETELNDLAIGSFIVTVTDENNCVAETDSIHINQPPQLFVDLELDSEDNIFLYGDTVLTHAIPSIDEGGVANTLWFPEYYLADTNSVNILDQNYVPLAETELMVTLIDTTGCVASDTVQIYVGTNFPFFVPNAFAPGSSNEQNAIFRPFPTSKVQHINYMRVFNRWGQLVYERNNFPIADSSAGWDGTLDGQTLPTGIYVYVLEVEFINADVKSYSGDVMLMR